MRLSIASKANQNYIKDMATRWQMTEKEALDYLLNQMRINGITAVNQTSNFTYDDSTLEHEHIPSQQSFFSNESSEQFVNDDPMISRLIAAGLELDF